MKGSQLGYILNSDMTVTSTTQSGKTPIGVVVCSYAGGGGQAMALEYTSNLKWGGEGTDISSLTNYSSGTAYKDTSSCDNTEKIIAAGDKDTYPAAWVAHEYSTEGTSAGDWCLPAAGVFFAYAQNQSTIDLGFRVARAKFTNIGQAWASTEYSSSNVWYYNGLGLNFTYKVGNLTVKHSVYPVIEF